jgi:hypothetical protein
MIISFDKEWFSRVYIQHDIKPIIRCGNTFDILSCLCCIKYIDNSPITLTKCGKSVVIRDVLKRFKNGVIV